MPCGGAERLQAPIVEDQKVGAAKGAHQTRMAPIARTACACKDDRSASAAEPWGLRRDGGFVVSLDRPDDGSRIRRARGAGESVAGRPPDKLATDLGPKLL